jgi:UDP-glucose 4-epimerase
MSKANILITGANGFVGRAILRNLTEYKLVLLCRNEHIGLGDFKVIKKELGKNIDYRQDLKGVDIVIHCAGISKSPKKSDMQGLKVLSELNADFTIEFAKQAAEVGVKRFIFISSIKVNGEYTNLKEFDVSDVPSPEDPYAESKLAAENGLLEISNRTNLEIVIIRPPLIYGTGSKGNFDLLLKLAKSKFYLPFKNVNQKRSMISVDNLVSVIHECLENPNAKNQIFIVSDGQDISLSDLIIKVRALLNMQSRLFNCPLLILKFFLIITGKVSMINRLFKPLEVNIDFCKRTIGWEPIESFDDGLEKCLREN